MQFIDTHSHLADADYEEDREAVIARAKEAGVLKVFIPNVNAASITPMLKAVAQHPDFFYPMIGLHPEDVREDWKKVLAEMRKLLDNPQHPFIAIGEVGLDYYFERTYADEQIAAFNEQVSWAETYHLPLMIHMRSALQEMLVCLKGHETMSGVFHCFSGSPEMAQQLLSFPHFALGIGGILTFKNSHLAETLRAVVPLERIVIETDAPYLAPTPYRGTRNESAYARETIRKLSEVYEVSEEKVAEITTQNARRIFTKAK